MRHTVALLTRALRNRDWSTYLHSERTAAYAARLSASLGLAEERVSRVRTAGLLHDVGKLAISRGILSKPGRLTEHELAVVRTHSEQGARMLAACGLEEIAVWVLHLHERYDGRGYPFGLAGEQIPFESRLLHAADALEAMTADRVYRPALSIEEALDELERGSGTCFDPEIASALIRLKLSEARPLVLAA